MDRDSPHTSSRVKLFACATAASIVLVCGLLGLAGLLGINVPRLLANTTLQVQSPVCGTWDVVSTPPTGMFMSLRNANAVAASPAGDVWLAATVEDMEEDSHALFARWNGSRFERVPGPDSSSMSLALFGMDISPQGEVWAVGSEAGNALFALRWNGSAWGVVRSPQLLSFSSWLNGVAAISENDVWAVGKAQSAPIKAHWDGTAWSVVTATVPYPNGGYFNGVVAIAPDDVWAVGGTGDFLGGEGQTLIEHWDGTDWSIVPSPNLCRVRNELEDVTAISRDDIWAVGYCSDDDNMWGAPLKTLIMHWDGKTWSIVQSPPPAPSEALLSVSAASSNDIWAVGLRHKVSQTPSGLQVEPEGSSTFVLHWDGSQWSTVPSPRVAEGERFSDVAVVSTSEIWAVGESQTDILAARFKRSPCPAATGAASP